MKRTSLIVGVVQCLPPKVSSDGVSGQRETSRSRIDRPPTLGLMTTREVVENEAVLNKNEWGCFCPTTLQLTREGGSCDLRSSIPNPSQILVWFVLERSEGRRTRGRKVLRRRHE